MRHFLCLVACCFAGSAFLSAQDSPPAIFPLSQVKPGMHAVGRTTFSGTQVEDFQVEILGVVRITGPNQSVIMARLSGGPLAETGVMEGMSGSPVYIDGKLVGAVALGFPFAKDAIAGITPIEEMIAQRERAQAAGQAQTKSPTFLQLAEEGGQWKILWTPPESTATTPSAVPSLPQSPSGGSAGGNDWNKATLPELTTPLAFSGFTSAAIDQFLPQWEGLGLRPVLGGMSSASDNDRMGSPADLHPGDMISVQLVRGDLSVSADGTVTYIDGNQVYAFGHRFLAAGPTTLPFNKADVVALIPSVMSSTKLSMPGERMGVIHQDLSQGVYGTLGDQAEMIAVQMRVHSTGQTAQTYHFEIADQNTLSPLLLNMALYSTLDSTQRAIGAQTLDIAETLHLTSGPDIHSSNLYSADQNGPATAAVGAIRPLLALYGSGLAGVRVKSIDLDIDSSNDKRILTLEQVWSDRRIVQPGQQVRFTAVLRAPDGTEIERQVPMQLPDSLSDGVLTVMVGEGSLMPPPSSSQAASAHNVAELAEAINQLPSNNELYVRVMRPDPSFVLGDVQLPSPPPSLARALSADPAVDVDVHTQMSSSLLDYHSEALPFVVSGVKTIRLTVQNH